MANFAISLPQLHVASWSEQLRITLEQAKTVLLMSRILLQANKARLRYKRVDRFPRNGKPYCNGRHGHLYSYKRATNTGQTTLEQAKTVLCCYGKLMRYMGQQVQCVTKAGANVLWDLWCSNLKQWRAKRVHWGTEFTLLCVSGHPVYTSVSGRADMAPYSRCGYPSRKPTEVGQVSLEWYCSNSR